MYEQNIMELQSKRFKKSEEDFVEPNTWNDSKSIVILNDDCLTQVFSFLPFSDRVRVQRVCKSWQTLSKLSWRSTRTFDSTKLSWGVNPNNLGFQLTIPVIRQVLRLCGNFVFHVKFSFSRDAEPGKIRFLGSKCLFSLIKHSCPHLCTLDVSCLMTTREGLYYLANNYHGLSELSLGSCKIDACCERALTKLFSKARCLRRLRMRNVRISGACFLELPADVLQELVLENLYVTNSAVFCNAFSKFHALQTLVLQQDVILPRYLNEILDVVSRTAKLRVLKFDNYIKLHQMSYSFASNLKSLEILEFSGYSKLNDDLLKAFSANSKLLKRVVFLDSNSVTDIGLSAIVSLPQLEYLELRGFHAVTDQAFSNVTQSLKSLKCISCFGLRNAGLAKLMRSTPRLELLKIRNCEQIDKNELIADAKMAVEARSSPVVLTVSIDWSLTDRKVYELSACLRIVEEVYAEYYDHVNIFAF